MKGLLVGNPQGFSSPSAISVGSTSLAIKPGSLLKDKVIVQSIEVQAPEITFETGLNVKENNLNKILANLDDSLGGGGEKEPAKPKAPKEPAANAGKKLQVDDFHIVGGKLRVTVNVMGNRSATLNLPEIRLKDLGQGPEGITAAELAKLALDAIEKQAEQLAVNAISEFSKGGVYMSKELGKDATNAVEKAKGLGDFFKKK
jgi:uncharacterized protein involved in outer membrane biogenesis